MTHRLVKEVVQIVQYPVTARKRKERDGEGVPSRSAIADVNEPSTSSNVKRTRMSCEGDHLSDSKNF